MVDQTVQQNYDQKKRELEEAFKDFHKIFISKVLDENKTKTMKDTETQIIDRLVKAVLALESLNVGEGILSLSVISLREQLTLRDRINRIEYELKKLQVELGIKNEQK